MVSVYSRGSIADSRTLKRYSRTKALGVKPRYSIRRVSVTGWLSSSLCASPLDVLRDQRQKKRAGPHGEPALHGLEAGDVRGLQALGALGDLEFNRLALVQRLVPFALNGGEVHEDVFTGRTLDEPEALAGVEPLYCSFSVFKLFDASRPITRCLQPQNKRAASVDLQPL